MAKLNIFKRKSQARTHEGAPARGDDRAAADEEVDPGHATDDLHDLAGTRASVGRAPAPVGQGRDDRSTLVCQ